MAKQPKHPVTAAIRVLRAAKVEFEPRLYDYVERGGTAASSDALGVPEHEIVKTLIMEDEERAPMVVLMHGDRSVATGLLAKAAGCKKVMPCDPAVAQKHSGYVVGGTSPFGLRKKILVYAQTTIRDLEHLHINGGKRGFLVRMTPGELERVLSPIWVEVAQPER